MKTLIRIGVAKVESRNERVRTRARYSRLATIQTLRSEKSVIVSRDMIDKDLFERGLHHLEPFNTHPIHRGLQQLLRVSAGLEAQFGVIAVIVQSIDKRTSGKPSAF